MWCDFFYLFRICWLFFQKNKNIFKTAFCCLTIIKFCEPLFYGRIVKICAIVDFAYLVILYCFNNESVILLSHQLDLTEEKD